MLLQFRQCARIVPMEGVELAGGVLQVIAPGRTLGPSGLLHTPHDVLLGIAFSVLGIGRFYKNSDQPLCPDQEGA